MRTSWMATMRRMVAAGVCAVLMFTSVRPVWAQERQAPVGGPYPKAYYVVRLTDGSDAGGQLEQMDAETLLLRPVGSAPTAAPLAVPMARVASVERWGNRAGEWAANGGLVFGLLGLSLGAMLVREEAGTSGDALVLAGGGVAIGAILGGSMGKDLRRKTTIYQRPGIALAPTRRGVAVSYHLPLGSR